jgi:hypothetical protein
MILCIDISHSWRVTMPRFISDHPTLPMQVGLGSIRQKPSHVGMVISCRRRDHHWFRKYEGDRAMRLQILQLFNKQVGARFIHKHLDAF